MVSYRSDELVSATDAAKRFGAVMKSLAEHDVEKIGVLKNNKVQAVILPSDEYERLKHLEELLEDLEDYKVVKERMETPENAFIPFERVLEEAGIFPEEL